MEVLHQRLINVLHRANALGDCEFGEPANLLDDLLWQTHSLLRKVLAKIGESGALFCKLLLLGRQGIYLQFILFAVLHWPEFGAWLKPVQRSLCLLPRLMFFTSGHYSKLL